MSINYKGDVLRQTFKADFVCYNQIVVELKAVKQIAPEHKAQVINYLRVSGLQLGILVNFGAYPKVQIDRLINVERSEK